jgi:hypothetical protein
VGLRREQPILWEAVFVHKRAGAVAHLPAELTSAFSRLKKAKEPRPVSDLQETIAAGKMTDVHQSPKEAGLVSESGLKRTRRSETPQTSLQPCFDPKNRPAMIVSNEEQSPSELAFRTSTFSTSPERTAIHSEFSRGNSDTLGELHAVLVRRKHSQEEEANIELALTLCESIMFSAEPREEYSPCKVLVIESVTFGEDLGLCKDDWIGVLRRALASCCDYAFAFVDVNAVLDPSRTWEGLLSAAACWGLLQDVGFISCGSATEDAKPCLILERGRETICTSSLRVPFRPPASLLVRLIHDPESQAETFLRRLGMAMGLQSAPAALLLQSKFVLDEWGYLGRVIKCKTDEGIVVHWGSGWDDECFLERHMRGGATRSLVPCFLDAVLLGGDPSGSANPKSPKGKALSQIIAKHNKRMWQNKSGAA